MNPNLKVLGFTLPLLSFFRRARVDKATATTAAANATATAAATTAARALYCVIQLVKRPINRRRPPLAYLPLSSLLSRVRIDKATAATAATTMANPIYSSWVILSIDLSMYSRFSVGCGLSKRLLQLLQLLWLTRYIHPGLYYVLISLCIRKETDTAMHLSI